MKDEDKLPIPQAMCIICISISLIFLLYSMYKKGETNIDIASAVAIFIALIGVASGLWAQVVQFKKDSGKISEVKSDTSEIKPQTANIDENVKKIRDEVVETLKPATTVINQSSNGVKKLVDELNYQRKLKAEISINIANKDYFVSGIDKLYEENAKLTAKVYDLEQELNIEKHKNILLNNKLAEFGHTPNNDMRMHL